MDIDPVVQAALEALAASRYLSDPVKRAKLIVAAVTPLIRAQAFTEAADAIDKLVSPQLFGIDREQQRIRDGAYNDAIHAAYRAVRGLGKETETQK